jgi:O-methyltransferase involved in polyketide biosynthesis
MIEENNTINLSQEKETLFFTLYAKAADYRSKRSVLNDKAADDLVKKLNIDIKKYAGFGSEVMVVRSKQFDEWIKQFLAANKNAIVVYAGCGLDTRIVRINPSLSVSWYDVDYPEVIALRKIFFEEKPGYKMIASSITESNWINEIPNHKPALIIAEGVFEYLTEDEVKTLLNRLTNHFNHGEIIFDVMNSYGIKAGKEKLKQTTGAVHKWAVDDVNEVDALNLKLKRVENISVFKTQFIKKLSFKLRLILNLANLSSNFKNMICLLRYKF